ncbi:Solute carrier 26 [Boothiomyces macroporosus]|uniref:Solute carrier 26 n=1 Tax=Boothiomyces macroporosus TaxID=261099 RepID=A0AAD5U8R3_9FUNG|nr:Solute carrier 26 [Boothiomyces macroporosus]
MESENIAATTPLLHTTFPSIQQETDLWHTFRVRLRYYIPILGWLPKYNLENLQSDLIAGFTVAFLIIPQSLSYAQALVNVPPVLGLYSAFIPQLIYAILGTSRQIAIGPEALVSILVGSSIKEFTQWRDASPMISMEPPIAMPAPIDPMSNIQATTLLCLMVGIFTFLLGFFRLGFLDSVLSRALLRGFVLAVACVVMIDMSEALLGLNPPTGQCGSNYTLYRIEETGGDFESPFQKLLDILQRLHNTHFLTASLSVFSFIFLLGFKFIKQRYTQLKWLKFFPEILILVVFSTVITQIFRWDCAGVAILNSVDSRLPDGVKILPVPTLAKIKHLLLSAILIAVIGFVESIAVAKTYASKHNYTVSPNRELVAMGTGNIISSFFGGFPGYGSLGRSAVNDSAGAKTQLAGLITGLVVFLTAIWLLPLFQFLPKAVCSSIIVVAALRLIELEDIHFIIQLHAWRDLGLLMLTFFSTFFLSIEIGTLLSVGVSLMLVVKHTTTTRLVLLGQTSVIDPETGQFKTKFKNLKEEGSGSHIERVEGGIIVRFEEGLFFGNVGQLKERLKRIELHGNLGIHPGEEPRMEYQVRQEEWEDEESMNAPLVATVPVLYGVVFDMKAVSDIDASATQTLLEIVEEYHKRNILVCFVKLREHCRDAFTRSGIVKIITPHNFYNKIQDAVNKLNQYKIQFRNSNGNGSNDTRFLHPTSIPFRRSPMINSPHEVFTSFEDYDQISQNYSP